MSTLAKTLIVALVLGCAASTSKTSGPASPPLENDLERAVFVGELEGDIPVSFLCAERPDWKTPGVRSMTVCFEGYDMVVYDKTVHDDGTIVESWSIFGGSEYQRVIRRPGKEPIRLVRAMCSDWAYRRQARVTTPPEGANAPPGLKVGNSEGFRCANRQTAEGAQIHECFLGGDALIFRYTRRPGGEVARSWFVAGGPEYYRETKGPGGIEDYEYYNRGICDRWTDPDTPPGIPPPEGRSSCECPR